MKVKDLIQKLQEYNPEANIIIDNVSDDTTVSIAYECADCSVENPQAKMTTNDISIEIRLKDERPRNCEWY